MVWREGMETCVWMYDDNLDVYESECEEAFSFISGNLKENNMKYCPFCGKLIKDKS